MCRRDAERHGANLPDHDKAFDELQRIKVSWGGSFRLYFTRKVFCLLTNVATKQTNFGICWNLQGRTNSHAFSSKELLSVVSR